MFRQRALGIKSWQGTVLVLEKAVAGMNYAVGVLLISRVRHREDKKLVALISLL